MVDAVVVHGWSVTATAQRFQVDAKTVRKWRDRFLAEGGAGLEDRSSRPRRSPNKTCRRVERKVLSLRTRRRWGTDRIANHVGVAPSTVRRILHDHGVGRLDVGDRATAAAARGPVRHY
jgi:transposase